MTRKFSLQPDEDMKWIYDNNHRDYNSDQAKDLREARAAAIRGLPNYVIYEALRNDEEEYRLRERLLKKQLGWLK